MIGSTDGCTNVEWRVGSEVDKLDSIKNLLYGTSTDPPLIALVKGDSVATAHYWRPQNTACLTYIIEKQGTNVILPNNETTTSGHHRQLLLSSALTSTAQTAFTLSTLKSSSIVFLGQLYDDEYNVLLTKNVYVTKDQHMIMNGTRNWKDALWDIHVY